MLKTKSKFFGFSFWVFIITGILTSLFWGGLLKKVIFTEDRINSYLLPALHSALPNYDIEVISTKILLADENYLAIKIDIPHLKLKPLTTCSSEEYLEFKNLKLPIAILKSIFYKKIIIENIELDDLIWKKPPHALCDSGSSAKPKSLSLNPNLNKLKVNANFPLKNIEINKVSIHYLNYNLNLRNLNISMKNNTLIFNTVLNISTLNNYFSDLEEIPLTGVWENGIVQIDLSTKYKEGLYNAKFNVEKNKLKAQVNLINFPMQKILSLLAPREQPTLEVLSLWTDCKVEIDYIFESEQVNGLIRECRLKGDETDIGLNSISFNVLQKNIRVDPIKMEIHRIPLQIIFKILNINSLNGLFSEFGELQGILTYQEKRNWNLDYNIKNSKLYFSKQGIRGNQDILSLRGNLKLDDEHASGQISHAELKDGEFLGKISFNYFKNSGKGLVQFQLEKINFSKEIQKLLSDEIFKDTSVFLSAGFKTGMLTDATGDIKVGLVQNNQFGIKNSHMFVKYNQAQLGLRLDSNYIQFSSRFNPWSLIDINYKFQNQEFLEFKDLKLNLSSDLKTWNIKSANAFFVENNILKSVFLKGLWISAESFAMHMDLMPIQHGFDYVLTNNKFRFKPNLAMKSYLEETNPEFKTKFKFKDHLEWENQNNSLKEIGKSALDKAKDFIKK